MIIYKKVHVYYEIIIDDNPNFAEYTISRMLNITVYEYNILLQSYGAIQRHNEGHLYLNLSCCFFKNENDVKNAVDGINSILVMNKLESK